MHLGLVGPLPPPNGGMAMQTLQLAKLLAEEGVDVELVQTNAPYTPGFVAGLKGLRALFRLLPYLRRVWTLAGKADVIHLMANSGWSWQLFAAPVIWAGWLRKTPVVVNYRGGEAREYLAASGRWVKPSLSRAAALVVPSPFLHGVFAEFGQPASVIPNIIDCDIFYPTTNAPDDSRFTLVITRNLEPIYGLDTAIRAMALVLEQIPGLELKIAGSGPQRDELEQLVAQLGLGHRITFLGRLERAEIVALYHSAHAMLNPSRVDNMPNSILEALACGLPVISTNVGGVPFMVKDCETALLVGPGNENDMARAILALYNDVQLRTRLIVSGQREVVKYTWERVGSQWLALYKSVEIAA